jgi:O-antigen ligase
MPDRQTLFVTGLLLGFVTLGLLLFMVPMTSIVLLGLLAAGIVLFQPAARRAAVIGLVLVPTYGFLYATSSKNNAQQLGQTIESGSLLNKIAGTLLLAIGVFFLVRGRKKIGGLNLLPWIGGFIAFAYVSCLWSASAPLSLRRATEALFVTVFALGVATNYYSRKADGAVELIRTICWASSLLVFAVLVVSAAHGDLHIADPAWRLGRTGIENQIAWCASVGLLAAWTTRARKDIWPAKQALWFNLAIPALVVLLTKSRETWLGVLAGFFVLEFLKPRALKTKIAGVMAIAGLVAIFAVIPPLQHMWDRGETEEDMQTASGRTQIWEQAMPLIRSHLLLGNGYGAFWTSRTVLVFSGDWSPTSLHNGYLDSVAEAGLLGILLIIVGVCVSLMNAWKLMKFPRESEIGLALLVLTVNFIVINLFGSVLEVFNYFPVTVMLIYSFFVSDRIDVWAGNSSRDPGSFVPAATVARRSGMYQWTRSPALLRNSTPQK